LFANENGRINHGNISDSFAVIKKLSEKPIFFYYQFRFIEIRLFSNFIFSKAYI